MNTLTQNNSHNSIAYNPNAALQFFKLFGNVESANEKEIIFAQGQKANRLLLQQDKMYLLLKGKVDIQIASETVACINPGEIFGELAALTPCARSATAMADTPCRFITLNEKQLSTGLKKNPEFALMLMALLVKYLRKAILNAKQAPSFSETERVKNNAVFNAKTLQKLRKKAGDGAIVNVASQQVIFQEGSLGMLMYVILEGHVVASIGDKVIERTGPGGVIGEVALIDNKRRTASVVAETNCLLLSFNRHMLLELVKTHPVFGISLIQTLASRLYSCRLAYTSA